MSENKGTNQSDSISTGLREDLILTAIRFLTHPNVISRPLDQKKGFLLSKGLTENEMQEAISRSLAKIPPTAPSHIPNTIPVQQSQYHLSNIGPIEKFRRILHTLLLFGGVGYGIYWIYKTYLEPFLFGKKYPKRKPIEERVTDLENTVKNSIAEIRMEIGELEKSTSAAYKAQEKLATFHQVNELQGVLSSVKGLLLSRQQFPPAPLVTPLKNTVSIPAWQLNEPTTEGDRQSASPQGEDI